MQNIEVPSFVFCTLKKKGWNNLYTILEKPMNDWHPGAIKVCLLIAMMKRPWLTKWNSITMTIATFICPLTAGLFAAAAANADPLLKVRFSHCSTLP